MIPIRRGDGSGLSVAGFSQVRKGDGTVLWTEGADIPDSGDLHARFDATELSLSDGDSVTTWGDATGNGHDLTDGGFSPNFQTNVINGNPVVRFDGVDDFLDVAFSALSQPNQIFGVFQLTTLPSGNNSMWDSEGADRETFVVNADDDDWQIFAGSNVRGGSLDTDPHIHAALFDGPSSTVRIDGTEVASGDTGAQSLDGFTLGSDNDQRAFVAVDVGEVLIYPQDKSGVQSDVESYLSDKWGVTL